MNTLVKLPIGIEDFQEIRTEGFYYVDKTRLISELLNNWGKVNLFTRPRRFGKSLNMNMLQYFFSYGCDPGLFDGLAIAGEKELCEKYRGQFPVIAVTLKDAEARNYEGAVAALFSIIKQEAMRFDFLLESTQISEEDKSGYQKLITMDPTEIQESGISEESLRNSLLLLSRLLHKHYGQKVILLIDEYDVPLDKAQYYGYYEEMVSLIRGMFGRALKTNGSLQFAVLTGCLRIAKESIFTGLNNFKVFSITDTRFDEHFGFSDEEVKAMLVCYGLEKHYGKIKEWYDGYQFGKSDVYCPWDVINYVDQLRFEPETKPRAFWINTSGNAILRAFLQKATRHTRRELERLVNGECVAKKINQELTYRELYDSLDNLWSILFTTGYLTRRGETENGDFLLSIPNKEIRLIFSEQILQWFQDEVRRDTPKLDAFCSAFQEGNAAAIEGQLTAWLRQTISVRDTAVPKERKESFYHGILLGLLSHRDDWYISSNTESGEGYSDILIEIDDTETGIVIELKYAGDGDLEKSCREALKQIEQKNYADRLLQDDMKTVLKYGIACHKKKCMVRMAP